MRMQMKLADGTTELDIATLPDGKTLIHWLKEVDDGPIAVKGHKQLREAMGQKVDANYQVACNPKQTTINPQKRGSVRYMCITSGDPKAATCPKCLALAGE